MPGSVGGPPATFDCLWCGTKWTTRSPDDLEGWARLCPDCLGRAGDNPFLRFRLRDALTARAAAGGGQGEVAPPSETPTPATPSAGARRRDDRLLRGPGRRVRRLVPAPRPLRPRAHPRRGLGRGARRRRNVARRPADPRRDRRACRRAPAGGRRSSRPRASFRSTTRRRHHSSAPASGSSPTASAPTSTSATRGPSRTARSTPSSSASG